MNMKKLFAMIVITTFATSFTLAAVEDEQSSPRVEAGSRQLSLEEKLDWKENLDKQEKENEELDKEDEVSKVFFIDDKSPAIEEQEEKLTVLDGFPLPYFGTHHCINSFSFTGEAIELEDGSLWKVKPVDALITLSWYVEDSVIIVPNKNLLSWYDYRLVNLTTGQDVRVNLLEGPFYDSPYSLCIMGIDYFTDKVYLNDGSIWDISWWDGDSLTFWLVGDYVIAGVNTDWLSSYNPYILINVNVDNYIRGDVVWY